MVMVMTAFSIVISVVVLDLHHHEPTYPVPRWLRRLAFGCMARVMCVHTEDMNETSNLFQIAHGTEASVRHTNNSNKMNHKASMKRHCNNSTGHNNVAHGGSASGTSAGMTAAEFEAMDEERMGFINSGDPSGITAAFMSGMYDELESIMAPCKKRPLMDEILQHLRTLTNKMKRNIKREQIQEEWKLVAKIIDRFLLIVFLLAIISMTSGILYFYPLIMNHMDADQT